MIEENTWITAFLKEHLSQHKILWFLLNFRAPRRFWFCFRQWAKLHRRWHVSPEGVSVVDTVLSVSTFASSSKGQRREFSCLGRLFVPCPVPIRFRGSTTTSSIVEYSFVRRIPCHSHSKLRRISARHPFVEAHLSCVSVYQVSVEYSCVNICRASESCRSCVDVHIAA